MSKALITGASGGIGEAYAQRLARRGFDLVLVARSAGKLETIAARLRAETGVGIETIAADLGKVDNLARVEARLREDAAIDTLVNNAGIAGEGPITSADPDYLSDMIDLNIVAVTRLATAIAPRLAANGTGAIVNLTSVTALMPAHFTSVYPATKAFVLAFSEALAAELGPKGVRVQAVLPGITRTAIWEEERLSQFPAEMVMEVGEMVDAALAGFDQGETITMPSLPDKEDFDAFLSARDALRPNLSHRKAAARYGL
ncbi:SDR family NAD(P)-dependent oxidoreductase [Rhizorhabdus dicambivorans]|uniref:NAD(P)-dependent oxidoreductase n=1 Tax=Rhizorhabdus dicambivorans TaxID=1850238 RepID=A0A2A4FTB8_9SPHN|nr:SDR family oxidoreductase [Rhizorhabdus dicambivorans]ATE64558.1 NAD(P)-dependent oxidoreductase [Rhizorhabdus dicambivorans]PCE41653.1 NAD(P)-dependent oxidoreductase [Rhizorhabdus dicambivorans]